MTSEARSRAEALAAHGDQHAAAQVYEAAGLYYEAGLAFQAAGEPHEALENLVRLSPEHPRYRTACAHAVRLALEGCELSLAFENLLATFVRSGPHDDAEAETFYLLGRLYERQGFQENAGEALRKLLEVRPDFRDAGSRLDALGGKPAGELPDLPEGPLYEETVLARQEAEDDARHGFFADRDEEEVAPIFRVGTTIANRYRLDERIGAGGMAVVFRARDLDVDDDIALKVFTQAVYDEETNERLKRELRLSRQLTHRNIVRLFDTGLYQGFRYVSMELLTGIDLRDRMTGVLPLAEGLDYLVQMCAGLQAAHDKRVVHRDVKPENCFITRQGTLKVMDFGIAKLQSAPTLTATGIIAGTPAYMAPEQVTNFKAVGPLADLYSVGIIAFEMFTGTTPFSHPEPMPLLLMHTSDPPPMPRKLNPGIPASLEKVILKCLAKKPEQRFANCAELAKEFEAIRNKLGA